MSSKEVVGGASPPETNNSTMMQPNISQSDGDELESLSRLYEALERLGDELASRSPEDLSFRITLPEDLPEVSLLGELINKISVDWETHVERENQEARRRAEELSQAYEALQSKNEEIHKDLETARRIQLQLLPQAHEMPNRPELEFEGFYKSMDRVGGDLYDLVRIGRNSYGVLLADVSGHGVPACLITMLLKVAFRTRSRYGVETHEVCREVNAILHPVLADLGFFVTAFFGIVDLENGTLRFSNCGHPPPWLFRSGSPEPVTLDNDGLILGPFDEGTWVQTEIPLVAGDTIFAYTDGITEARNYLKEMFTEVRLKETLIEIMNDSRIPSLPGLLKTVERELDSFTMGAPAADDQTMSVFRFLATVSAAPMPEDKVSAASRQKDLVRALRVETGEALQVDHWEKAETLLRASLALDTRLVRETLLLAAILRRQGKVDEAHSLVLRAWRSAPRDSVQRQQLNAFLAAGQQKR